MNKRLAVMAGAAAVTMVLSGCGSDGASADKETIKYWACQQGGSVGESEDVLKSEFKRFTDETGINVDLEVIGWSSLQTRLQTAITSGQAPDVSCIGNTWATSLGATGAFLPFDDDAMDKIGGADKFVPSALAASGPEGKAPTSVPLYAESVGLYYNKKMFADAHIKPPKTWDSLVHAARQLTDKSNNVYGLALTAGGYTENAQFAFTNAAQNGASLFDDDGEPTFTSDGVVDGIKRYVDLMQNDGVVNTANAQYDDGSKTVNDFATGKAAMVVAQSTAKRALNSQGMDSSQYGVIPYPTTEGGEDVAAFVSGENLSIFKNTDKKDNALELVKFMTSVQTQAVLDKHFHEMPVLKDGKTTYTDDKEEAAVFKDIYENKSKPLPQVPAEDQFESTVGKAMNNMFAEIATGKTVSRADIVKAMETAQQQVSTVDE